MAKATATLIGQEVTREQLASLPKPKQIGPYHKPVAHVELIETLEERIRETLKAKVLTEKWALRRDGSTLFGVLTMKYGETDDTTGAIGIRHANDMSLSMQFVAGMSVFVCENMVLRGDLIVMRKRHTLNLNLTEEIDLGLNKFKAHFKLLTTETTRLRREKITDEQAKGRIHDAFIKDIMPIRFLPAVSEEYFKPRHKEFKPRTAWSLHNAFTEVAKQMPMTPRMQATQDLGAFFGMTEKAA